MWGSGHTASWEPKLEESLDKVYVSKCALGGAHALIIGSPLLEPTSKSFIYGFGNNLYGQVLKNFFSINFSFFNFYFFFFFG